MSREFVVTRRKRMAYRHIDSPHGLNQDARVIPCNPANGAEDVPYDGPAVFVKPEGTQITISNRSGARKKI